MSDFECLTTARETSIDRKGAKFDDSAHFHDPGRVFCPVTRRVGACAASEGGATGAGGQAAAGTTGSAGASTKDGGAATGVDGDVAAAAGSVGAAGSGPAARVPSGARAPGPPAPTGLRAPQAAARPSRRSSTGRMGEAFDTVKGVLDVDYAGYWPLQARRRLQQAQHDPDSGSHRRYGRVGAIAWSQNGPHDGVGRRFVAADGVLCGARELHHQPCARRGQPDSDFPAAPGRCATGRSRRSTGPITPSRSWARRIPRSSVCTSPTRRASRARPSTFRRTSRRSATPATCPTSTRGRR